MVLKLRNFESENEGKNERALNFSSSYIELK